MKNFWLHGGKWRSRIAREPLALFLDYDGTLSAIAATPEDAVLSPEIKKVLRALTRLKDVKVAIVSGRSLRDLRRKVPVAGLTFIGSHGLEMYPGAGAARTSHRRYVRELRALSDCLKEALGGVPGVLFEKKPLSLAIHYRRSSLSDARKTKNAVARACADALCGGRISVMPGKKVLEIMPSGVMGKGVAVRRLLHLWGGTPRLSVFLGDDRTDEAAFKVLCDHGLTIRVGKRERGSCARYFLNTVEDVKTFLEIVVSVRTQKKVGAHHDTDAE